MIDHLRRNWILLLILGLSVVLRIAAVIYMGNTVTELPGTFDQISYHNLALRVSDGHGFSFGQDWWPVTPAGEPTAHWSFLYTAYLSVIYTLTDLFSNPLPIAARLLQAVAVGILHPLLTYLLGREVFDELAGLMAAGITALYSYFIYYSASLMTEPFYIVSILASLYLAILLSKSSKKSSMKYAAALGLVLGTTVLLRQLYLLFVPFLFAWVFWIYRKRNGQWPLLPLLTAAAIIVLMLVPLTVYNYLRFDEFVLLNSNSGYAFFLANHPIYGTRFVPILPPEMGTYLDLIPKDLLGLSEVEIDKILLQRGLEFVIEDPGRYLLLSLSRVPVYFTFWPSAGSGLISNISRVSSFGLMLPFMLLGLFFAFSRRKDRDTPLSQEPMLLLILFAGVYSLVHILSWTLIRYRLPVDAVMVVFAGLALAHIFRRINIIRLNRIIIQPSKG